MKGILYSLGLAAAGAVFAQTSNPFPNPIAQSGFVAELVPFASVPDSGGFAGVNQFLQAPGGQLFALDQRGPIYTVSADGSTVTPYVDLRNPVFPGLSLQSTSERGLQSMAFHPDFATQGAAGYGKFYTAHSSSNRRPTPDFGPGPGNTQDSHDEVILEWTAADPLASTFAAAVPGTPFREIIRMQHPFPNHNTGLLAFNPNAVPGTPDYGALYIATGDGGDPLNLAQNQGNIFGKILRIDPLGSGSTNGRYGIPGDNPLLGQTGVLPEIWASGLRNPQRYSWDVPVSEGGTGRMFIADIGQGVVEEINLGVAGGNYGWNVTEGSLLFIDGGSVGANVSADPDFADFEFPLVEYDHSEGNAVTAGFVMRNGYVPLLDGQFLFGDIANGRIFFTDANGALGGGQDAVAGLRVSLNGVEMTYLNIIRQTNPSATRADLRFGQDASGRIYVFNKQDGMIYTFVPVPEPSVVALLAAAGVALVARSLHRRRA